MHLTKCTISLVEFKKKWQGKQQACLTLVVGKGYEESGEGGVGVGGEHAYLQR